jgi:chromosome segregation ATPase
MQDQLADSARQHLAALRGDLESKLTVLEEVLGDPSRGESLAGLILDLSRIATREAQAAATQACLAARAEADKEIGQLRNSARAALDAAQIALRSANASVEQERATNAELRKAADLARQEAEHAQQEAERARQEAEHARQEVDRAQQEIESQARLLAERGGIESELTRQHELVAQLQQAVADAEERLAREQAEGQAAYDALVAQLESERDAGSERERALTDSQATLAAERAAILDLRGALQEAESRSAALERERNEAADAHNGILAELGRAQSVLAELDRARADLQSQIDGLQTENTGLHEALRRSQEQIASIDDARSEQRAMHDERASDLEEFQRALGEARRALAAAEGELEGERAAHDDLRRIAESTDQQLASARSGEVQALASLDRVSAERDALTSELNAARQWIAEMQAAEAEFGALNAEDALAPPAGPSSSRAGLEAPRAAVRPPEDEGWQAVRLASRYIFAEPLTVQINGNPGRLCDLSISGCQVLSPTALKPNQVVKIQLSSDLAAPVTCTGRIVWTRLEAAGPGRPLSYRAGVRFTAADEQAIESFATLHGATG